MENEIWNNEENNLILKFLEKVDRYQYYFIKVKAEKFIGEIEFCIFEEEIERLLKFQYSRLYINDFIIINDYDSNSFIKFTVLDILGKILVNGKFESGGNSLNFEFLADQTILQNIIYVIKNNYAINN